MLVTRLGISKSTYSVGIIFFLLEKINRIRDTVIVQVIYNSPEDRYPR